MCVCVPCACLRAWRGQKKESDPPELLLIAGSCELPCGCREANLGSLKSVFLTAKPSLQPCFCHDFRLRHVPGSLECRIDWNWVTISALNFVIDNCQNSSPVSCK